MAQEQVQIQTQKQQQVQRLSQQQMLQVKLLEMPLTELEECVNAELDDNPALERGGEETDDIDTGDAAEQTEDDDFDTQQEREERQDALDSALERMKSDDDIPTYDSRQQRNNADYEEIVYGDTTSFIDKLNEQVGERELTGRQRDILEYLIGSLDNDGLLRKDLGSISDELAIYHGIDAAVGELEEVLKILQDFDPPASEPGHCRNACCCRWTGKRKTASGIVTGSCTAASAPFSPTISTLLQRNTGTRYSRHSCCLTVRLRRFSERSAS